MAPLASINDPLRLLMTRETPAPPDEGATGAPSARLGVGLLGYMVAITLIVTLLPFRFSWPSQWRVMLAGDVIDVTSNVLLFVPLGFLFRLARRHAGRHSALRVLGAAALLSMTIEGLQLFEVERYASAMDVAMNALGAWLGAVLFDRLAGRDEVDAAVIGRLALELPLMGLVYLLLPLLWLNALATGSDDPRFVLALLLGLFGANVLGGIQRHHFARAGTTSATAIGAAAGLWFLAGAFPAVPRRPLLLLAIATVVGVVAWWRGRQPVRPAADNRRFEVPVLKASVPAFGAYLLLHAALPLLDTTGSWGVHLGFPSEQSAWTRLEILRLLERIASYTLLGYMLAEFRGRVESRFVDALPRLGRWGAACAFTGEAIHGFHDGRGASVVRMLMVLGAALYGGWLYHVQRDHVVRVLRAARGRDDHELQPVRAA